MQSTMHTKARAVSHSATAASCPAAAPDPVVPAGVPAAAGKVQSAFALRYIDTVIGTGEVPTPGEFLTVHYTGWLASDGTKFDSSVDRGEPITFQQGVHRVIPGWDGGFGNMHVGGKRRLFIPYQLAYGDNGRPPVIPPQSDLIFDIELVAASPNDPSTAPLPAQPATPPNPPAPPSAPGSSAPQR